ncbi:hypothetical protein Pint_19450 [Pistacia integerrima]|uniref:Uncharacterized protein n=1 Tax=Pistacia integerrima TaxID=434235 RepID=A0ACC0YU41_9ROSI|nr:hypothetical protein Pint_19450 [Pistacia integerrima]
MEREIVFERGWPLESWKSGEGGNEFEKGCHWRVTTTTGVLESGEGDDEFERRGVVECELEKEESWTAKLKALVRVYERMLKGEAGEKDEQVEELTCKMIVGRRVGKVVEKIKSESGGGTQVRVVAKDQILGSGEACVRRKVLSEFYELTEGGCLDGFEIIGSFPAVRKALSSVSSCGQDSPREDAANRPEIVGAHNRMYFEEDVVFKLLCHLDKIPCRDTLPLGIFVMHVHSRIAETGFEPGGYMISEMRDTGASIRVFPREQAPKCGSPNDEVVQCCCDMTG